MLNAIITANDQTAIIEFPIDQFDLYKQLGQIGIRKGPHRIPLTDDEDAEIQVKLYADNDFGNHVIRLFHERDTLDDVHTAVGAIDIASDDVKEQLEEYILHPLDEQYRPWFITAFGRLVTITSEDNSPPYVFHGNVKKVKIHSNNMGYGFLPREGTEVEQHLTITDDGRVWLTRYAISEDLNFAKLTKTEQRQFKISSDKAKFLLDKYTKYFRDEYEISFATDVGSFEMQITDDEGKTACFIGPLICEFEVDGYDLSQLTRDTVEDQTLFVFDNNEFERIERITIDHEHKKKIVAADGQVVTWNPTNHIVIDRKTDTIEYTYKIGTECDVTRKYHVAQGVSNFLDELEYQNLFVEFEEKELDAIIPADDEATYTATVDFLRGPSRIVAGRYDKQGLPIDWPEFIEDLYDFMSFYGFGEMFDEKQYGRTYRKTNDYIFLSVRFGEYGKTYYYLTEDDTIQVGDQVVVPVGSEGKERIVEVAKKEYYSSDRVPMPIEKVKSIVGKFIRPEENDKGEMMIYCPMCECEISADTCYDILYDPLVKEVPGIITEEKMKERYEFCSFCKYNDE